MLLQKWSESMTSDIDTFNRMAQDVMKADDKLKRALQETSSVREEIDRLTHREERLRVDLDGVARTQQQLKTELDALEGRLPGAARTLSDRERQDVFQAATDVLKSLVGASESVDRLSGRMRELLPTFLHTDEKDAINLLDRLSEHLARLQKLDDDVNALEGRLETRMSSLSSKPSE